MRKFIVSIALLAILSGCGITRHEGRVETFDAAGKPTGSYVAILDRPMMIEVVGTNGVTVKADSRGSSSWGDFIKGMMEIVTLGLMVK